MSEEWQSLKVNFSTGTRDEVTAVFVTCPCPCPCPCKDYR
jgi:hypothetical protein